jgi:hypothetical protein
MATQAHRYSLTVDGETVAVDAIVYIPSARESADGEVADVDFVTVDGKPAASLDEGDDRWQALFVAVVDAEYDRRAAGREEAAVSL